MHPHVKSAMEMAARALRLKVWKRSHAYKAVFMPDGTLSLDAEHVLADLRERCRANETTFHADPYQAARLAGRREIWLRIMQHLNLDEAKVQQLVEIDDGLGD